MNGKCIMMWPLISALVVVPQTAFADQCQLHFVDYTKDRYVPGPVNTECPPSLHSPGWGNWGVDSPHGGRYDGAQFPGIHWDDGKVQWNSCTQDHGPDPNGYWYNYEWVTAPTPGYSTQFNGAEASHANYWTDVLPWSCEDYGTIYTINSYFMNFYERDWPDADDFITTANFASFNISLTVDGGYRSGDSGWISITSGPVRPAMKMFLEMWE